MNYSALSLDELCRMASTDAAARQHMADNAEKLFNEVRDDAEELWEYDPAGCYDDGNRAGRADLLLKLEGKYHEPLSEYCESRSTPDEFWIVLEALLADIKDEPE